MANEHTSSDLQVQLTGIIDSLTALDDRIAQNESGISDIQFDSVQFETYAKS
ncbi:hypothetical protein K0U27_08785 [archaeon]|nr:hypothetical protein [archaeon]